MKYKIGDKVWVEYGFSVYKGKVVGVKESKDYIVKYRGCGFSNIIVRDEKHLVLR